MPVDVSGGDLPNEDSAWWVCIQGGLTSGVLHPGGLPNPLVLPIGGWAAPPPVDRRNDTLL